MEVLENLDSLLIDISNISNDYSYAYEVEEFIYKNIDDLLINVLNMSNDFEVIPNFDIKRGLAGFLLTKIVDGEEKCINYFYPFLGKVFEPVVETVNINDLMKFLSKHECYSCDSPKSLEMGFVHYDINLNKSFIKKNKNI